MKDAAIAPVQMSVSVPLPPEEAFDLFTSRIGSWWPLGGHFSVAGPRAAACFLEPFAGGRVYERAADGEEHEWGEVLIFDPPRRLSMSWHPGHSNVTEVEVRFTPSDDGTFVELEHRGWEVYGDRCEAVRGDYEKGWPFVLSDRFVSAARSAAGDRR